MSLDDYEKNKLIAETEHLKALTKELEEKSNSGKTGLGDIIKKWTGILLSIISVVAAIWGLLLPINSYIQERKKMLKYDLNNQMVGLMQSLDSQDPGDTDRSILLLSYYERNSLPILFYKLERSSYFENQNLVANITQVIANIYVSNKDDTKEILNDNLAAQLDKLSKNTSIDHYNLYAIYNLIFVIEQLPFSKKDTRAYLDLLASTEQELIAKDPDKSDLYILFTKLEECETKLENQ